MMEESCLQRETQDAQLRHEANIQGGVLLIYYALLNVCVFAVAFAAGIAEAMEQAFGYKTGMQHIFDSAMDATGYGYLFAVAIGLLALFIWKKPAYFCHTIGQKGSSMTLGSFFALLSLAMAPQLIAQLCDFGLGWLLEQFERDASLLQQFANVDADTPAMFVYIGIAAPIAEELLFRGLLLRSLAPYSRKLAIVASAVLFGLFHGNLIQTPYAIGVGMVLGYVALEYHVLWAIVLHLCNNLLFALALPAAVSFLPAEFANGIVWAVIIGFFIAALLVLISKNESVFAKWKEERVLPQQRRAVYGSPTVIILVILCGINMLASILLMII